MVPVESSRAVVKALKDAAEAYIEDILESGEEIPRKGVEIIEAPVVAVTV